MSSTTAPAGWYADPYQPSRMRYFDGTVWTDRTTLVALTPPAAPTVASYSYPSASSSPPASDGALQWVVPVGRTGLSIAAGYAGIAALLCFYTSPLALVLGLLALRQLRDPRLRGRGRAWFGTIAGGLGCALFGLFFVATTVGGG